jgi:hypothetical protein
MLGVLTLLAGGFLRSAEAATGVTVTWDSNRESDLAGYYIEYGRESGRLSNTIDVGNHTTYRFADLDPGFTYFFAVLAYNTTGAISQPSQEVFATIGSAPLTMGSFIPNVTPPRPLGSTIIFVATATGGSPPYQYKYFVSDGSKTAMVRDWSPDNTFSWRPTVVNPNYAVKVWARTSKSTADAPETETAQRTIAFGITAASSATVINLVSDRQPPQRPGTAITFTASAAGAGTFEFQWSVFDGTNWKIIRDYASNTTFVWTPTTVNPKYQVMVRVRGGQSLAANAGISLPFPIQ